MSLLSIPSTKNDDPNYRYKMPRLVAKVEGRGNGIRTNIMNMGEIARALKRPAAYPTKFCGIELGAQSKFDQAEGKAIVNGAHEQRDLQLLIDKFIDKFVLCQNCNLPEIDLQIKKERVIYRCNACGNQGEVDNAHKLATFILRNPPDGGDSTLGKEKKKSKESKHKDKSAKKKDDDDEETEKKRKEKKDKKDVKKKSKGGDSDDDETGAKKDHERKKSKKSKKRSKDDDDDDDQTTKAENGSSSPRGGSSEHGDDPSTSAKKVDHPHDTEPKKKKKNKESRAAVDDGLDDLHYTSPEVIDVIQNLVNFITSSVKSKAQFSADITPDEFFEHLRILQVSQSFNHCVKVFVALDALFNLEFGFLTPTSFAERVKFLKPVAQGVQPRDILTAMEDFISTRTPAVVPEGFKHFPRYLHLAYEADILEDAPILHHYNSRKVQAGGRKSYEQARAAAAPFLKWLAENDEGVSEEEGDAPNTGAAAKAAAQPTAMSSERDHSSSEPSNDVADSDDDLDIDDI